MKPYWEADGVTLYHGDCLEVLPTLEAGSVDAVFADYPFGYSNNDWDCQGERVDSLTVSTLSAFQGLISITGSVFAMFGFDSVAHAWLIAGELGFELVNWIIWRFDTGYHPTTRFKSRAYHILWLTKGDWKFNADAVRIPHRTNDKRNNPKGAIPSDVWTDIIEVKKNSHEYTGHKGQKPVALVERCIRVTTDGSDTVLDPFMGSGTTGVACVKTGRRFIGIEIDEGYCEIAKQRIEEAMLQPRML